MSRDFSTVVDDFSTERTKTKTPGLHFDIKRFLSLRLLSVLLIAGGLSLPLAIVGWLAVPDVYTASAVLQFRSVQGRILEGAGGSATVSYEKFVGTELAKLKGNIVLSRVLDVPEVRKLSSIEAEFDKLAYLMSTVSTSRSRNSELVTVYCTMKSQHEALEVLRNVMEIYEKQIIKELSGAETYKVKVLNADIENYRYELDSLRTLIRELEGELGTMLGVSPGVSIEGEQYRQRWLDARERTTLAENAVANVEKNQHKIERLQENFAKDKNASIYDFGIQMRVLEDPRVSSAQSQLNAMESKVAVLAQSRKPGHPALEAANRELESVRATVVVKEQLARGDALKTLAGQLVLDLDEAKSKLSDETLGLEAAKQRYDDYVAKQESNLEVASKERANIQQLQEKAAGKAAFIAKLEAQVQRIQLDEKAPARVSVVSQPYSSPSKDRKARLFMAVIGLFAALGMGMTYGVVRELLDRQIRTRQDIARVSDLPTIASIPHLSEDRFLCEADCAMLMAQHPNSTIADEYRRILARMLFPEDNAAEISSLMIVSASTQEGKTSIAANLAIALEQANRRVLLLDLSSQKPDIERAFGLEPAAGLSELLQNEQSREELLRRTAFENLGIVGPGADAEELAGRLASRAMMDFMEWADEHFDHIIVDTPPLLLMSDAKLLAPAVDGVLFVVGAGAPTLGMVSRCLNDLEQLQANVIGVVINGIRSMRGGYLRKNQRLYYAYTQSATEKGSVGVMPEINVLDEEVPETPEAPEAEVVLLSFDDKDT